MNSEKLLSRQWITVGAISGIIANILFPILLLTSLPSYIEIFLASIFGILFSLVGFALHHLLKYEKITILTQLGAIFIFCSGVIFNLMLMVQLTFKGYLQHYQDGITAQTDIDLLNWIAKTVDPVHLGMQLSNDFFTAIAMLLFSIVMLKSKYFGKIWGISGFLISISLILIKCYAFPMTPYEIGFPYIFGPLMVLWFLAVCIQCLRKKQEINKLPIA
ncbi:hypothetical protein [Aquimarina algiphila]|uniref:hypothetical protein n=1 Tax=Aquimarina algiphila TaxID=2047982 RepID=UPI0024931E71|nr:hypothetical protein [Aquimarina algiphila]